jgi:hypothetical protein
MTGTASVRMAQAWFASEESRPLPEDLLDLFERSLGADLSALRVYDGPAADAAARALGADAYTCGSGVFFRQGAYQPRHARGLHLLAHEVAHAVQQAEGRIGARASNHAPAGAHGDLNDPWEDQAEQFAATFVAEADRGGRQADGERRGHYVGTRRRSAVRVVPGPSGIVQRHASFEHRYLGDGEPADLYAISTHAPTRTSLLKTQLELMDIWRLDPANVTPDMIRRKAPGIHVMELGPDKVPATYGEVNALPDYLADTDEIVRTGRGILLPILQCIRQESYNQFTTLMTGEESAVPFALAANKPWKLSLVNNIVETDALDRLTTGLGVAGQDHYRGLLARNACHFAPYSWHRWSASHVIARDLALRAHRETRPDVKKELVRQAWTYHGYADHFLQDSFAAGHLIDKTLVMQWFVEWAAQTSLFNASQWVADWERLRYMTAGLQPGLSAGRLYDPGYQGPSNDPQTVQESASLLARLTGEGVGPGREAGRLAGYSDYLTFLTSAVTQLAAAELHDSYNGDSLWVSSPAHPAGYRIWGDDTLLSGADGGEGVLTTSLTADLSRRALTQIIDDGGTGISVEQIRRNFPTKAGADARSLTDLRTWATGQKSWCEEHIFEPFTSQIEKYLITLASPRLGTVSRDQPLGQRWSTGLGRPRTFQPAAVLPVGRRVFASCDAVAYELDPVTGGTAANRTVALPDVGEDTTAVLAADSTYLYIGVSGRVHALPLNTAWSTKPAWSTQALGDDGATDVDLLLVGGRLFAGTNGYVYELRTTDGAVAQRIQLREFTIGTGYTVKLATDGSLLYAGTHAYAYALQLNGPWNNQPFWTSDHLGIGITYAPVSILSTPGHLYASSAGYVYELKPSDGSSVQYIDLASWIGQGDYTAALASDGGQLYVGTHGYAYALPIASPWGTDPTWTSERLSAVFPHSRVSLVYRNDQLFAGCDGYMYELGVLDGVTRQQSQLTTWFAVGDLTTELASDGTTLFAGVHGYAYAMLTVDQDPTPTAAWRLAQTSGTTVPDQRGISSATATAVTWQPLPAVGGCAVFNGSNSVISTPRPVVATGPGSSFTVQAWVRLDGLPTDTGVVVSQAATVNTAFTLYYSPTWKTWVFSRPTADRRGASTDIVVAGVPAAPGVWTHIAGVYDVVDQPDTGLRTAQLRIYVNGTRAAVKDVDPTRAFDSTAGLLIGRGKLDGVDTGWLRGAVRNVTVHARALDTLQLEPDATAFWRLADASGPTADDATGAYPATATDVRWEELPGIGGSASFNGTSSTVTTAQPVALTGAGGSFTVAAWVRLTALPAKAAAVISQDGRSVSGFSLQYAQFPPTGTWLFARYHADVTSATATIASAAVPAVAGRWTHVTGVYDARAAQLRIYVDGVLKKSTMMDPGQGFSADGPLVLGRGKYDGAPTDRLNGTLRDARVYRQALTAEQITALIVDSAPAESNA